MKQKLWVTIITCLAYCIDSGTSPANLIEQYLVNPSLRATLQGKGIFAGFFTGLNPTWNDII